MNYYDQVIADIAHGINENIKTISANGVSRDLASKNILADLRHFVEHVILQIYCHDQDPTFCGPTDEYQKITAEAFPYVKTKGQFRFLLEWHDLLQKTNSHYATQVEEGSRLLLHYLDYLVRVQEFENKTYGLKIIPDLSMYPFDIDRGEQDYYSKVVAAIAKASNEQFFSEKEPYYVMKKRLIRVTERSFFELTLSPANDHSDKFNRVTVFTEEDVMTRYAIRGDFYETSIDLFGKKVEIRLFKNWEVSIRPCELNRLARIVGVDLNIKRSSPVYQKFMRFIKDERLGINDLLALPDQTLRATLRRLSDTNNALAASLIAAAKCIRERDMGWKTLLYLYSIPRNAVIKSQEPDSTYRQDDGLNSTIRLSKRCFPFEKSPFSASLISHNPAIASLTLCFDQNDYVDELLARFVRNRSLHDRDIFVPEEELSCFGPKTDALINQYNGKVLKEMQIGHFHKYVFLNDYLESTKRIIDALSSKIGNSIAGYSATAAAYYSSLPASMKDDLDKEMALKNLFTQNSVSFLYGPAGTGKTTFITWVCDMFKSIPKIIAAQTKSALDHLRRVCNNANAQFVTLSQLKARRDVIPCKLLIVDECSTSDNLTMARVLQKVDYEAAIFAGDIEQLEPIRFGNWFLFAKRFFAAAGSVFELTNKYRTSEQGLLSLWDAVRTANGSSAEIGSIINRYQFSKPLDERIFEQVSPDEITLCLNYDGVFGINNINDYLQASNPNAAVVWGHKSYKKGDPILFIDNSRFPDLLYNNLKGKIIDVSATDERIVFRVEAERIVSALDIPYGSELKLIETTQSGSVLEFPVYAWSDEYDDSAKSAFCIVPFQVAYSVSIHKAQGLEYDSVKIVITSSVDEGITRDVFYTAITRAKKTLRIFWSPESEQKVLSSLEHETHARDIKLFNAYYSS